MYDERSPSNTTNGASTPKLKLSRSGVDYSRFTGNDTAEELITTLLRQLNVWCESGVSHNNMLEVKE